MPSQRQDISPFTSLPFIRYLIPALHRKAFWHGWKSRWLMMIISAISGRIIILKKQVTHIQLWVLVASTMNMRFMSYSKNLMIFGFMRLKEDFLGEMKFKNPLEWIIKKFQILLRQHQE